MEQGLNNGGVDGRPRHVKASSDLRLHQPCSSLRKHFPFLGFPRPGESAVTRAHGSSVTVETMSTLAHRGRDQRPSQVSAHASPKSPVRRFHLS